MPSTRMRRWSHWTLRSRLALASTALAAVALLVANGAGLLLLDSYLLSQVDSGLKTSGGSLHGPVPAKTLTAGRLNELLRNPDGPGSIFAVRFGSNSRLYVYDTTSGTVTQFPEGTVAPGPRLPGRAELAEHAGKPFTVLGESGAEWRIYVQALDGKGGLLVNTTSLAEVDKISDRLLLIDATVMSIVLALLGAVAALLVRVGLRPLTRMQATSESIAAGDFRQRVTGTDPHTEPGRLGRAINAMLGRVESEITARTASEQRLRRFLADASHELRTPLTSIRGFAELYRRDGDLDLEDAMRRIEAEAERMGMLVEDLVLLARLDEQREPQRRPVDLLELAADVVRDLHARSPRRAVRLTALDESCDLIEPVVVRGDPLRLRQVLANLLANADRHTPPEARITLRLGTAPVGVLSPAVTVVGVTPPPDSPAAVVEVEDTGSGVPPQHAPYIFERLYRADPARSSGGSGLGLSIAAALAGAHGGRLELAAPASGTGATFRLILPLP
ncbi:MULTISPECIES: HAMP domain-containing sensor histidine kinase [unclassified Streptomyces]|uniref:sensor histidine kinase n=1 Tax=unclassified Streptomyces TaxID=2593676 RepID=UPI002DD82362|nr:HAMP domain-containing sensor histidine kinase [Streptomyces sp. NBC_00243]WRZ17334.1 HAMP domain-containing histidine kinase [Streptomyces sp. NBC_00243]